MLKSKEKAVSVERKAERRIKGDQHDTRGKWCCSVSAARGTVCRLKHNMSVFIMQLVVLHA